MLRSVGVLDQVASALPSYEVGEELGRGSTGVVLAAHHRRLGRDVAIKLLPPDLAADSKVRHRFVAEARLLASFSHVHIVPIFDFVEEEGLCLLVMERLGGGTLDGYARAGLDAPGGCAAVLALCAGLQYAHERDVLHRDVKPANVLVAEDGLVKVTDFGIAKVLGGAETLVTRSGFVLGTPAYMAPEQAEGAEPGPATDVYGAGTVLYELLAGRLPFGPESSPLQMLYSRVHGDPEPLPAVAPELPEALSAVVMKALERSPDDRQASAEELGVELASAASGSWGAGWIADTPFKVAAPGAILAAAGGSGGSGGQAPPLTETVAEPPAPEPPAAPPAGGGSSRRRLIPVLLAALALLVVAAGALLLLGGDDDPDEGDGAAAERAAAPTPNTRPASAWDELAPADGARQQAPGTVLAGTAWVLGGLQDGPSGVPAALRSVEGFDTTTRQWKTGPELPTPVHHAMAVTYRDEMVLMGGWIPSGSNLTATSSKRVFAFRGGKWVEIASMREPRVAGAAGVADGRIVVVGGQANDRLIPGSEVFDGESWKPAADIPTPREHLAAASDGDYVYAIGGRDLDAGKNSAAFQRYDPDTDRWERLPDMPEELGGLGAAYVEGRIVAVGGETSTDVLDTTLVYDLAERSWSRGPSLGTARHGMAVVGFGDTVYALDGARVAGHTRSTPMGEALSFEPRGKG